MISRAASLLVTVGFLLAAVVATEGRDGRIVILAVALLLSLALIWFRRYSAATSVRWVAEGPSIGPPRQYWSRWPGGSSWSAGRRSCASLGMRGSERGLSAKGYG